MAGIKTIMAKLGNMRKSVEWVIYPRKADEKGVVIQSDKRICMFKPDTGEGILSAHCATGARFLHLNKIMGATFVMVPKDVIDAALASVAQPGQEIGPGVYVAPEAVS